MAHTNVSGCVLSIVTSFSSGLDVFKQLREKRTRRKHSRMTQQQPDDEELHLTKSLRQGPEDIGREYQRSIHAAGDYFAVGDATAQTSLAEVLLKLNTGLVTIITSFLKRDKKDMQLDYQSLTTLSEQSRIDTCRTLRQLSRRMHRQQQIPCPPSGLLAQSCQPWSTNAGHGGGKQFRRPVAKHHHTKIRGPTLARVIIQDSSKPAQIAMVKPGDRKKKKPSSSGVSSRADSAVHLVASTPSLPPYDAVEYSAQSSRPLVDHMNPKPEKSRGKKPAATNGKSQPPPFEPGASKSTFLTSKVRAAQPKQPDKPPPPVPYIAPLPAIEPEKLKNETEKHYSFVSASTKLGEIPLHKWPQPFDFDAMSLMNREAERNGWPVALFGEGEQVRKKRFGFCRFFRKKDVVDK
ncbi:hypothetical protein LTR08_002830 [Meristemomyces frigidus]|nr:hypothetical protein LTR08_002830 [Meristemomyces frigidus]